MKRSGFTLWKWLVSGATLLLVAAILWPATLPPDPKIAGCLNNLKQIGLALAQYSQDYDERLPLIALSPRSNALDSNIPVAKKRFYGWADALTLYTRHHEIFQCPSEKHDGSNASPIARGYTDYWFNANLSGFAMQNAKSPAQTVLFGDGNDGSDLTDARYNLSSLPAAWLNDQNSPASRHYGRAHYVFLDGRIKNPSPNHIIAGAATFSPK